MTPPPKKRKTTENVFKNEELLKTLQGPFGTGMTNGGKSRYLVEYFLVLLFMSFRLTHSVMFELFLFFSLNVSKSCALFSMPNIFLHNQCLKVPSTSTPPLSRVGIQVGQDLQVASYILNF